MSSQAGILELEVRYSPYAAIMRQTTFRAFAQEALALRPAYSVRLTSARPLGPPAVPQPACCRCRSLHTSPALFKKNKPPNRSTKNVPLRDRAEGDEPGPSVDETLDKIRGKMSKAVDWARTTVFEGVERAGGRVSPALLDGVKVTLPDTPGTTPLVGIASVTAKQQSLFVEVFDTSALKHVESAIHKANIPGISPQRASPTTLKIPVSRPTTEQRTALLRTLSTNIEDAKIQVRRAQNDGHKLLGGRGSEGTEDVGKLGEGFCVELDEMLTKARRELEKA